MICNSISLFVHVNCILTFNVNGSVIPLKMQSLINLIEDFELYNLLNQIDNINNFRNIRIVEMLEHNNVQIPRKYRIKKRVNPIQDYDENEFKHRFRFSKNEVKYLYDLIDGQSTLEPIVNIFTNFSYVFLISNNSIAFDN